MDWHFWLAIGLAAAGWYFTGLLGAQLLQHKMATEVGSADESFEFRRLWFYLLMSVGLTIAGGWRLYVL
jgi:hypothetical protein